MFCFESVLSQFLRIVKCKLKLSDFVPKAKQLFLRMTSQEENQATLLKYMKKSNKKQSTGITFLLFEVKKLQPTYWSINKIGW